MPVKNLRAEVLSRGAKRSGKRTVTYLNGQRRSMSATVVGAGTTSGLKLSVPTGNGSVILDDVPVCSTSVKASCYIARD